MNFSSFGKLNLRDAINGCIVAAVAAILSALVDTLQNGQFPDGQQLKSIGLIGLTAGLSYLVKNLFSNSQGEVLQKEPV